MRMICGASGAGLGTGEGSTTYLYGLCGVAVGGGVGGVCTGVAVAVEVGAGDMLAVGARNGLRAGVASCAYAWAAAPRDRPTVKIRARKITLGVFPQVDGFAASPGAVRMRGSRTGRRPRTGSAMAPPAGNRLR